MVCYSTNHNNYKELSTTIRIDGKPKKIYLYYLNQEILEILTLSDLNKIRKLKLSMFSGNQKTKIKKLKIKIFNIIEKKAKLNQQKIIINKNKVSLIHINSLNLFPIKLFEIEPIKQIINIIKKILKI